MYLDYLCEDTCIPHVFFMYPACLLHIRYISLWMHLRFTCISSCILDVSRMYLDHPCRYMYLTCISHVSRMYPASQIRTSQDTYEIHVSCMYLGSFPHVSLMYPRTNADTFIPHVCLGIMHVSCIYPQAYLVCIQRGSDEASKIHVS